MTMPESHIDPSQTRTARPGTYPQNRARWPHHPTFGLPGEPNLPQRIEEVFGWIKAQAGVAKVKLRGCAKIEAVFIFTVAR